MHEPAPARLLSRAALYRVVLAGPLCLLALTGCPPRGPETRQPLAAMTLQQVLGPSMPSDCEVMFGVYDLATRQVLGPEGPGLVAPPSSFEELEELAVQVADHLQTQSRAYTGSHSCGDWHGSSRLG